MCDNPADLNLYRDLINLLMTNVVVVGSQWGDEGKGKIVDWLSEQADVVIRFQGGHNAGHTLVFIFQDLLYTISHSEGYFFRLGN